MGELSILGELTSLAAELIVCLLIWRYYKRYQFRALDKYETFCPRFWTSFVDSTVLWPLTFLTFLTQATKLPTFMVVSLMVFSNLGWLAYTILLHARSGQTVGKWVTQVRVVDFKTEQQISLRQACMRESIPLIIVTISSTYEIYLLVMGRDFMPVFRDRTITWNTPWVLMSSIGGLWFLAEIFTMLTNKKRRALHDFMAGTIVVRTNLTEIAREANGSANEHAKVSEL